MRGNEPDSVRGGICHLVPHIGKKASGYSYSVPRLCQALTELGQSVSLITLGGQVQGLDAREPHGFPAIGKWKLRSVVFEAAKNGDLMHSHSLWRMSNILPAWAASSYQTHHVVSPRGTLSREAMLHNGFAKAVFSLAFQKRTLQRASMFHVTSEAEYLDVRGHGFRAPIAIVPNGVDLPEMMGQVSGSCTRTLLYVGRIHPIKGLELLLDCWRELAGSFPDWVLRIIGPLDNEYARNLKADADAARLPRLEFVGEHSGERLNLEFQTADGLVLPSLSENFGMVVAEALANGTPVLTTLGTPWERLVEKKCGWWVDRSRDEFGSALSEMLSSDRGVLSDMGMRGRQWVTDEFSWERVAREMLAAYSWLKNGGERPEFILEN